MVFALAAALVPFGDEAVAPPKREWFEPPVRLEADGKPIDHGATGGLCAPTLHDLDGDGARDLVVGDGSGRFTVYRNVGTAQQPHFARLVPLEAGGVVARVPVGDSVGSSPRFADFDGDGSDDLLSGCYDPGTFWLFRGRDDDNSGLRFDAGREILDSVDDPLKRVPEQAQEFESFGSWLDLVDWDDDGDLDLVGGGFGGELYLFVNEGTRRTPSYFPLPHRLSLEDGSAARVPGGHGSVVAADWDGDGLFDLVCGSASGAVVWFRNVNDLGRRIRSSRRGAPILLAPETLVPAAEGNGFSVWLEPGAALRPGIGAQVDVVDWNGDGKLDLLVGDFSSTVTPRNDLTVEQKRAVASLRLQHETDKAEVARRRRGIDEELEKFRAGFDVEERERPDVPERIRRRREQLEAEPAFAAAAKRSNDSWNQIATFLQRAPSGPGRDGWQQPHGAVWLYLRK